MTRAYFVDENDEPLRCHLCGQEIDFDKDTEENGGWFHILRAGPKDPACAGPANCEGTDTPGGIKCNWGPECDEIGRFPLIEEVRNESDHDEVLSRKICGFLCQRHLKNVALILAKQPVPYTVADPYNIEEVPS